MRLLTDQDVYTTTIRFLQELGHNVLTATDAGLKRAEDTDLLSFSHEEKRCFITRDRDFGRLAFSEKQGGGIIYLRMTPSTVESVHNELNRVLNHYAEDELQQAFVVIEPGRHRHRKLS